MLFDFTHLDGQQFETLCGALLAAEGFKNLMPYAKPGQPDRGVDWIFEAPDGRRFVAQAKLIRKGALATSQLSRAAYDLESGLSLLAAEGAFLMVSANLTNAARDLALSGKITIWDADELSQLLEKHPAVRQAYSALVTSGDVLQDLVDKAAKPRTGSDPTADNLLSRLEKVEPGRRDWRSYEDVCIDILNYAFVPPLRLPKIQVKSEDGLDRRDAIYPITTGNPFWESIKYEFSSRLVVAEFKNYSDPIGQTEVESLQQYLLPKAKRSLGLLCSRYSPSDSALKARRRAWMLAENIILFLSDQDLKDIVSARALDGEPSDLLEAQMDQFFITLSP